MDKSDLKRDTANCLAKLKANFVGTEYMLWGRQQVGASALRRSRNTSEDGASEASDDDAAPGTVGKHEYSREDLCLNYKATALDNKPAPRAM